MNLIPFGAEVRTMTSREVADLTGKRHDNVMNDIRKMLDELGLHAPDFSGTYRTDRGNEYECFHLPKRECLILVSGYNVTMRARIVDRWQELEGGASRPAALPSARQLAMMVIEAEDARERAEAALALAAPKVAFVEKYVEANSGSQGFRQVCKLLEAPEREFRAFLVAQRILYKLGGEWVPYQPHIDAGRFEMKAGESGGHVFCRCLFTAKGVEWVAGEWGRYKIRQH